MSKRRHIPTLLVAVLVLCAALPASATTLGVHDWETTSSPPSGTWTNDDTYITLTDLYQTSSGPTTSGWLKIDYAVDGSATGFETDYIYTPASELFSGDWTNTATIAFDFWASNTVPAMLQVVWHTTNATDNIWSYTLDDPTTNSWTHYVAPLLNWEDWEGTEAFTTEDMYLSDLAAIDWIGIAIRRYDPDVQEFYGIDNFVLMIPEPCEIFMLAAALMTSAASLRRRKGRAGKSKGKQGEARV